MPNARNGSAPKFLAAGRDPTIRSRVISLIAILLLPLFVIVIWLAGQLAAARTRAIETERSAIAEKLTQMLDLRIATIQGMLKGLASSEELSAGNFASFEVHARAIVRQPEIRMLRVISSTGEILSSTDPKSVQPLAAADLAVLQTTTFLGHAHVSDFHLGTSGEPDTFSVIVPVFRHGAVIYALSAEVLPETFSDIFERAGLPSHWISAVVDRSGRFVARSLHPEKFQAVEASSALVQAARGQPRTGQFTGLTLEGADVVTSYEKSSLSDWTSAVGVPKAELQKPVRHALTFLLVGGGAISLLSLGLASLLAARIYAPVRQLRDETVAMMSGRTLPERRLRIAELNDVRNAFSTAISKSAHLAAIVASSNDAIIGTDLEGRVQSWNFGAEHLFGYSANEMIGRSKTAIVPEQKIAEFKNGLGIIRGGKSIRTETVRRNRDGKLIDVSIDNAPILDINGRVIGVSSIIHDITKSKATEKHQRFLMRELTHRSKNLLAIVQSMARQTARSASGLKDFEHQYMQRIQGLAASHDLLVNQNWAGAPLDELIRRQVTPFVETNQANLAISGPDIMISAKAAQTIGLALHELATNSMKHGALSTSKGKVSIEWGLSGACDDTAQIELKWQEHDGPAVSPPSRKGFGHFVIDRMITQTLRAKVTMDFDPQGFSWTMLAPLSALQKEPEFEGAGMIN